MIQKMISDMQTEQNDDDKHKEWCGKEIDLTEDALKETQDSIDTHAQKLAELGNELETAQGNIATLTAEIADIDLAISVATTARGKEKSAYTETMSEITISLSLLKKARDRMAAFYVPKGAAA